MHADAYILKEGGNVVNWAFLNIIIHIDIYVSVCTGHLVFHTKSYFQYYYYSLTYRN